MKAELQVGAPGSFVVKVDGQVVAQKERDFPTDEQVVDAVRARLART